MKVLQKGAVAFSVVASLVLTGCGGPSEEPGEPESFEGLTLRMVTLGGSTSQLYRDVIERFEAETGVDIEYIELGNDEAINQEILALSTGSKELDIILVESGYIAPMSAGLEPLTPWIERGDLDTEAFVPAMYDLFSLGGEQYAIPFRVGGRIFMYNTELLAQAGYTAPPSTSAEFLEIAKATTKDGHYGYAATLQQGNFLSTQWTPWLRSFGSEILDADQKCAAFNDSNGLAATEFFVDLYRTDGVINPDAISWVHDGLIANMQTGGSAMAIGFSGWYGTIVDPSKSSVSDVMAVAPNLPHGPNAAHGVTDLGGWGVGINAAIDQRNKEAAWAFLLFATSPENQLRWALDDGNTPVVASVFEDADYLKMVPDAANFLATYETGVRQRPAIENYGEIEQVFARVLSQALVGDITPAEALDRAEDEVNDLLGC